MHIAVLGMGALGRLYAACLARNQSVYPLTRQPSSQPLSYRLEQLGGFHPVCLPPATAATTIDLLLVCVKAYQVESALLQWRPLLTGDTTILLLHNGMGTLEPVSRLLPGRRVLVGTTTHGALLVAPDHVRHSGQGRTIIGHGIGPALTGEEQQQLVGLLDNALPTAVWDDQIERQLWLKLAINAVINPLTTLHNCANGELAAPRFQTVIATLIDELALFFQTAGIDLDTPLLTTTIANTIAATATNFSSMNRDMAAGRPTEIEAISGHLLRQADNYGLPLPSHRQLYQRVVKASGQRPEAATTLST